MKIVVLDGYAANPGDISWDKIKGLGELTVYDRTSPDDIIERSREADILFTNKCKLTGGIISALPKLKYIGELATGYNNIDVAEAEKRGIAVTNIPGYSTGCVAQLVMAFILEQALHVGEHSRAALGGQWASNPDFTFWNYPLTELDGKKLGIIGNGAIGKKVGNLARAFGMEVKAYSPSQCGREVLDGIIETSDIISLNCPLKKDNEKMIDAALLKRVKKGLWLINTARGGLIDEEAVCAALENGTLGCYCADVMTVEPIAETNPLLKAPNVIMTPHIGWAPYEARVRLMDIASENLRAFINGERLNRVDGQKR